MGLQPLEGFIVGVTADRRADEQVELLCRRGARTVRGPTISTAYLGSDEQLRAATAAVIEARPSHLVLTTGIGIRAWFEAAQSWGLDVQLLTALEDARVFARGPKAAAAAQTVGLRVWRSADDERMEGIRALLAEEELRGATVAVQCFGDDEDPLAVFLAGAGARVVTVRVYRWDRPSDEEPARALVRAALSGEVDAVTFTSAPAVRNLFAIARDLGVDAELRDAFNTRVIAACIGSVCADAAREHLVIDPLAPEVGRLGLMVRALCERLGSTGRTIVAGDTNIEVQGRAVLVDGDHVWLTHREAMLLDALIERPGAVASRSALRRTAWGNTEADDQALTATIARLRRKLGRAGAAIRTLPRRGYRIDLASFGPRPD